ncbi:MAG: response regulator [Thermoanaerobaculaceae bacterium]|jgi:CheY-like chemotaxis protein|nr:response regulator [Thermoanaerobaculaceae bacterium]
MSKVKILTVDDDRDLVEALRIVLESGGYDVVAAHDAETGLEKVRSERPDLVLLDVMMPSATEGFHFVWKLRNLEGEYYRAVPVILLTAIHEKTELRFYPDSGDGTYKAGEYLPVQDFVDKPVEPKDLLERVERVLSASKTK